MITRYTEPEQLAAEFMADREKAQYWQKKLSMKEPYNGPTRTAFRNVMMGVTAEARSETYYYQSPSTGNRWMLWWKVISEGIGNTPTLRDYTVCYQMTEQSMTIMVPTTLENHEAMAKGITIFTDHMFLRMHQRLGVDMSDREEIIRNFVETVMAGCIDIRDPREGETDPQVVCRLPKSWLRGHYIEMDDLYLIRFNTFYTDNQLTSAQRRYLKSFAKFADKFTSKNEIKKYFQ